MGVRRKGRTNTSQLIFSEKHGYIVLKMYVIRNKNNVTYIGGSRQ